MATWCDGAVTPCRGSASDEDDKAPCAAGFTRAARPPQGVACNVHLPLDTVADRDRNERRPRSVRIHSRL
jgi:hypothetical protein